MALAVSIPAVVLSQGQAAVAALPQAWVLPPPAQVAAGQTIVVRAGRMFDPRSGTLLSNQVIKTLEVQKFVTNYGFGLQAPATATPEPGSWILLGMGLAAVAFRRRGRLMKNLR